MRRRPFSLRCTVMLYPHLAHFITPLSQLCAFARVSDLCVVRELILTAQEQFRGNKAMTIQYCKVTILILTQRPSPLKKIKELYHLRWGIETSFRELKHIIGLSCLHGKKTDFLLQEVFARLIFYNYASLIARQVPAPQGKQINFSVAILACKQFLKGKIRSAQIFEILSMHLSPIRPGRQYKRYQNPVSAVAFQYRLS